MLLVWVLFGADGDAGVLFGEDADDADRNFLVDYGLVVFAYDVDTAFLSWSSALAVVMPISAKVVGPAFAGRGGARAACSG
jgi:hypothetical protein